MLDEATVRRLFSEEAARRGITLSAELFANWQVHERATEEEARQAISHLLTAGKTRYPWQNAFWDQHGEHPGYEEVFRGGAVTAQCMSCGVGEFSKRVPASPATPPLR